MADDSGATDPQVGAIAQPQAGTDSSSQAEGAQTAQVASAAASSGTEVADLTTVIRERDDARREAARHRTELSRLQAAQRTAEQSQLTEAQRAEQRLIELEQENAQLRERETERELAASIREAAGRAGFRNPELAVRLIDRAAIEAGEDGRPRNLLALTRAVLERDPYLARTTDFGGGDRGASPRGDDFNAIIRRAAGRPG